MLNRVPLDILYERLASYDPIYILELLQITSEDLLDAFKSRIKKFQEELSSELDADMEQAFNPGNDDSDDHTFDNYDSTNYDDFLIEEGSNED